jgi:Glycosyl hydrolase family 26
MLRTDLRFGRFANIVALLAVCGILSASSVTSAVSRIASNPSKFAGAFVNWGSDGREHTLQAWEKWLKQPPSSVLGVDFYAQSTWEDFSGLSWVPGIWKKINPARNVVWSVPLTVKGTALADVAAGMHDAEFEAAAKAIADAQPGAIIRLGWEMNLASMAWFARGQEADYIAAFRRVVEIFRRYSKDFKYDWCPGWGPQDSAADLAYPGDDVVDFIGLDVYDFKYDGSPEERWNTFYLKSPFGLEWQKEFAERHGKGMSYPEWGVGNFGDNPFFIEHMHDWFLRNQSNIAYAAYFDVNGLWPTQIDNSQFPRSRELFRKLFGRT